MPRPHKRRHIQSTPEVLIFKPAGVPARLLKWTTLTLDEVEAIRQIDHLGKSQEEVAEAMGVSRPTVTRIYQSARRKIANVLVNGQALRIEGGPVNFPTEPTERDDEQGCGQGRGRGQGCGHGHGHGRGRKHHGEQDSQQ